jgi:hypothetical protein
MQWLDRIFLEYLYQTKIEFGLTQELLELGGCDLVPFLQSANNYETTQVQHSLQVLFLYSLLFYFFNRRPIEL